MYSSSCKVAMLFSSKNSKIKVMTRSNATVAEAYISTMWHPFYLNFAFISQNHTQFGELVSPTKST